MEDLPHETEQGSVPIRHIETKLQGALLDQFDKRILALVAEDILTAHSANSSSWALYLAQGGVLTLAVGPVAVIWLVGNDNGFWLSGALDDSRFESLKILKTKTFEPSGGFKISGMTPSIFLQYIQDFSEDHNESVRKLAKTVQTSGHWHGMHQDHTLAALENVTRIELPIPQYKLHSNVEELAIEHFPGRRYWKFGTGTQGKFWDDMIRLGRVGIDNWSTEPVFLDQLPNEHDSFIHTLSQKPGLASRGSEYPWRFMHEVKVGDLAIAMQRNAIVGWGRVSGDYEYVGDNELPAHQRAIKWIGIDPRPTHTMSQGLKDATSIWDPAELTPHQFAEAIGAHMDGMDADEGASIQVHIDPLVIIHDQFSASGLHYTDAQIATFYTSLQTKGFVVLSGISGTGKSKIATGFVEMLPDRKVYIASNPNGFDELITFQVRPYMRKRHQIRVSKSYLDRFPSFSVFRGSTVPVHIGENVGTGNLRYEFFDGKPTVSLWMHKALYQCMEDWTEGESVGMELNYDNESQEVVGIRLFELEGVPDAETIPIRQSNHLFLSVRPDWRDSTSLLGYYNPLTQTYEWTDFLRFLIRAGDDFRSEAPIAWFVILDEMNLAHVEYYFADLLSVIESGRDNEGWTKESLRLTYPDTLDDEVPPHELKLPPNLYIIGTVNMDETTHAFSPKVLDRAFTIELADVDFSNYPITGAGSGAGVLSDVEKDALLQAFTREGRFAFIDKGEIEAVVVEHPRIRADLQTLNALLQPYRMHFGYRVFDEICQYLHNNDLNDMMPFADAFDQAVFMKVLPKFTGSRARLQSPLHGVLAWAIDPIRTSRDDVTTVTTQLNAFYAGTAVEAWTVEKPTFPTVAARVRDMLVALERDGFVSFG